MHPYLIVTALWFAGSSAAAQPPVAADPAALSALSACRSQVDPEARLACYDREVAALEAAVTDKRVVVMDRDQVRRTRRTLFGLALPNLSLFGDNDEGTGDATEEEDVTRLETTIKRVAQNGRGIWSFELEEGGRWSQIDSRNLVRDPKPGSSIVIRRAAMGSYLANIDGQIAIRVRRAQ